MLAVYAKSSHPETCFSLQLTRVPFFFKVISQFSSLTYYENGLKINSLNSPVERNLMRCLLWVSVRVIPSPHCWGSKRKGFYTYWLHNFCKRFIIMNQPWPEKMCYGSGRPCITYSNSLALSAFSTSSVWFSSPKNWLNLVSLFHSLNYYPSLVQRC